MKQNRYGIVEFISFIHLIKADRYWWFHLTFPTLKWSSTQSGYKVWYWKRKQFPRKPPDNLSISSTVLLHNHIDSRYFNCRVLHSLPFRMEDIFWVLMRIIFCLSKVQTKRCIQHYCRLFICNKTSYFRIESSKYILSA